MRTSLVCFAVASSVTSCDPPSQAPTNYPIVQAEILRDARFAPLLPTEIVDVYPDGFTPSQYALVGNINLRLAFDGCHAYHADKLTELFKDKARQMGADGIIGMRIIFCEVMKSEAVGVSSAISYSGVTVGESKSTSKSTSSTGFSSASAVAIRTTAPPLAPDALILEMRGDWQVDIVLPDRAHVGIMRISEQYGVHFIGDWDIRGQSRCRLNGRVVPELGAVLLAETRCDNDAGSATYHLQAVDVTHLHGAPLPQYKVSQMVTIRRLRPEEGTTFKIPSASSAPASVPPPSTTTPAAKRARSGGARR